MRTFTPVYAIIPLKKLLRIGIYTSLAIGFITMGAVYVISIIFARMDAGPSGVIKLLASSSIGISIFVFTIWLMNIAFLFVFNTKNSSVNHTKKRYGWSFLTCFLLMLSLRLLVNPLLHDPEKVRNILAWKVREFGFRSDSINYVPYNNWIFLVAIMVFVVVSVNTVVLIIQDLVLLIEQKTRIESENVRLRIKNVEAANQKLKQQLQPHFLFNSLNVLKTLIRRQPDNAEAYLKRLSDFLRASVSFDNENLVKLEEELKLSMDYLEMQKIRFGEALQFDFKIPEKSVTGLLPVFSLQLLLENAIKHNAFTTESPLKIVLEYKGGWIRVSNNRRVKKAGEASTGLGLVNLSERYRILSGDEISIHSTDSDFSVSIKILDNKTVNTDKKQVNPAL